MIWTAARLVGAAASLVANAVLARVLAPSELGAYYLAASIVMVGTVVARMGLPRTATRLVAEAMARGEPSRARGAVRRVLRLGAASSAAAAVLAAVVVSRWLGAAFDSPVLADVAVVVGLWLALEALRSTVAEAFRGFHELLYAALCGDPGRYVFNAVSVLAVALLAGRTTLDVVVAAATIATGAQLAIGVVALRRRVGRLGHRLRVGRGAVLGVALPLMVVDVTGMVLNQAPLLVVGLYRPETDTAVFGAAFRVALLLAVPLSIVNAVIGPTIAHLNAQGRLAELEPVVRGAATLATVPMVAALAVLVAAGGPVLGLLFGDFAPRGASVLAVMSVGQVVMVGTGSCGIALAMTGHERDVLMLSLLFTVLSVAATVLGVQVWGMLGAAVASSAGLTLQNMALTVVARRRLGVWTHASFSVADARAFLQARL